MVGVSLCLFGCTQTRKTLGLDRTDLDGFDVYDHPDLTVPPQGAYLPKPDVLTQSPLSSQVNGAVRDQILGKPVGKVGEGRSAAVQNLLDRAGAKEGEDAIRSEIDGEAKSGKSSTLIQKMLPWQKKSGDVIDPQAEYDRFRNGGR